MILDIYNPKSKKRILPYQNFLKTLSEGEERIVIIASLNSINLFKYHHP